METTVIATVQVTRIIDGECGNRYPDQVFAKQIAETIREEMNLDDVLIDSVKVFVNEKEGETM